MTSITISPQMLVSCVPRHEAFMDHGKSTHIVIACLELRASRKRMEQAAQVTLRMTREIQCTIRSQIGVDDGPA
jgi:hypothetical protein